MKVDHKLIVTIYQDLFILQLSTILSIATNKNLIIYSELKVLRASFVEATTRKHFEEEG